MYYLIMKPGLTLKILLHYSFFKEVVYSPVP